MRVVFDTNIFISALVFPGGQADQAMKRVFEGQDRLLLSLSILRELLDVLARKFGREPEELAHVAVFLQDLGEFVEPKISIQILSDEPDNRILECAVAGNADLIVTGDRALLDLGEYEGIRVIPLRAYLEAT